ncbi:MAG: M48 family metallopeptidase [Holophaga sp.]|nr:M48 family metallopeptidase [Holophaga sp.]
MKAGLRTTLLVLVCGATGGMMWFVARRVTPQQAPTFRPLLDRATEAKAAVDRVGQELAKVSTSEEIALGQHLVEQERARGFPEDVGAARTKAQAYLQGILAMLVNRGEIRRPDIPYHIQLIEHPSINAFALPGGALFVTTGMLDFSENEAELAAVIGHEMAHVDLRHCIEHYQYELRARKLGGAPLEAMASMGAKLMLQGYQDEQEAEADRWGMQIAARAGYHPQAGQCLFARMQAQWGGDTPPVTLPGEAVHSLSDALEDLFSSHPRPSLRIANLERAQKETALDPERNAYYLGLKNRNALSSRTEYEIPAEVVSKRIYPPKAKAARP